MNKIIKSFENSLGYVRLEKTENDTFVLTMHSDFAQVGHFLEYEYRSDAMGQYQFYHFWLIDNEKNCKAVHV